MSRHDRDPKFLHPVLAKNLGSILGAIRAELPGGWDARLISGHRTPEEQFEIYKKGREFSNGAWVKVGPTFTNIDGFNRLSRHNYLPALAIDVGLFRPDGSYEPNKRYETVAAGARKHALDWGGDWKRFVDRPHVEVPPGILFQDSLVKDVSLQWQKYLRHAGAYRGNLDGIFGTRSRAALEEVAGSPTQTTKEWALLHERFGPVHELPGFDDIRFIPAIP